MRIFGGPPIYQSQNSALRLPAAKRISVPNAQRLLTITEGSTAGSSNAQPRGILLNDIGTNLRPVYDRQGSGAATASDTRSLDTTRTAPPPYTSVPETADADEDLTAPVEGEKLAQLRRSGGHIRRKRERGGWARLCLIFSLVLLVVIALAVGLGVGLSVGRQHNYDRSGDGGQSGLAAGSGLGPEQAQQFPLGEYSFVTALRTVDTNCTSNPSTWRCYPYTTYDPSGSAGTHTSSLATFNWIISNISTAYSPNETTSVNEGGIPANLTISSTSNPFSIMFTDQPLTYYASSGNTSAERYEFSFQQHKTVIPASSLTSSGAASECFFNSTTFTGTLYLSAQRNYPDASLADSTGVGGYPQWPYAVEIRQDSPGGENIPACYEMANGEVEDRILTAVTPEPERSRCLCDYRNY